MMKKTLILLTAIGMVCTSAISANETPATYHVETEKLHIPRVDMFFGGKRIGIVETEMQLMPHQSSIDFTVKKVFTLEEKFSELSMNENMARRFREEVYSSGNLDAINEIFASNVVITSLDSFRPDYGNGIQAVEKTVTLYREAFPDIQFKIEDIFAVGNKVTLRWTAEAKHTGDLPKVAATGIKGTLTGVDIFRFKDGKIAQWWVSFDSFGLLNQIGVIAKEPAKPSVLAKHKNIARLFLDDLLSQGDLKVADEIMAPDAIIHRLDSFTPDFGTGPEAMKKIVGLYRNTFNDLQIDIGEIIANEDGDRVIASFTINGTHTGDLPNIPATEIEVSIKGIDIYHIVDGQIVEFWHDADTLGLMKQLGAVAEEPVEPSILVQNQKIARLFLHDILSEGKLSVADEIMASDVVIHLQDSFTPDFGTGPDAIKQIADLYRNTFPDIEITIDEIIATEDKVTSRFTINGTHKGDLPGIPATGEKVSIAGMDTYHIKDGQIIEFWHDADTLGLMKQLGAISEEPTDSSVLNTNQEIVRLFLRDILSEGKLSVADEIMAPNAVIHLQDSFTPDFGTGPEAVKKIAELYRNTFPDIDITVDEIITTEDKAMSRFTINGVQTGDLPGIPATGKSVSIAGMDAYHIKDGQIVEFWHDADTLGLMKQLGVIPIDGNE